MRVEHIGIAVEDVDIAVEKYRKIFSDIEVRYEKSKDGSMNIAFLEFDNVAIELLQPLNDKADIDKFIKKSGEGIHHLAFEVDNINKNMDNARKTNIRLINEKPIEGSGGSTIAFLHPKDMNGTLVELCEFPDKIE